MPSERGQPRCDARVYPMWALRSFPPFDLVPEPAITVSQNSLPFESVAEIGKVLDDRIHFRESSSAKNVLRVKMSKEPFDKLRNVWINNRLVRMLV